MSFSNKYHIKKYFLIILLFATTAPSLFSCKSQDKYIKIDNGISIKLTGHHTELADMLEPVKKINDKIIWIEKLNMNKSEYMFGVSRYVDDEKYTIQQAFDSTAKNYTTEHGVIMQAGSYKKNGMEYFYKITETMESEEKNYSIIYYAMPNNYSDTLYEFKIVSDALNKETEMNYLENVVNTAIYR